MPRKQRTGLTDRSGEDYQNMTDTTTDGHRLELYVRSLAPTGGREAQEAAIERLDRLERTGTVDAARVHVWGREIAPDSAAAGTESGRRVLDRIEAFETWARRADVSLASFFRTREVHSEITGRDYRTIVLPGMALAEYRDDTLAYVTPCSDDGQMTTVTDRLETLELAGRSESGSQPQLREAVRE